MLKAQIVKCSGCGHIIAACTEPHCYEDKTWHHDVRLLSKIGHEVSTVNAKGVSLQGCVCEPEIPVSGKDQYQQRLL